MTPDTRAPLPPGRMGLPLVGETRAFLSDPFTFIRSRFREHGPMFKTSILGKKVAFCVSPEALAKFSDPQYVARDGATPRHVVQLIGTGTLPSLDGARQKRNKRLLLGAFQPPAAPLPLPFGPLHRAKQARVRLVAQIGEAVSLYRGQSPDTVVSRAAAARDEEGKGLSEQELTYEMLHLVFGGYAALAGALTNTVTALADHEEVCARARAEVREKAATGELSFERLGQLEYLGRVWREVNRYYPAFPNTFFVRVIKEFECEGVRVPAGWLLTAAVDASLHNGQVFDKPDEFDPERFAPPRSEHQKHEGTYVPHGGGPPDGHRCIGETLTATVVKLVAAKLLRACSWRIVSTDRTYNMKTLPPRPRDGLRVRVGPLAVEPA